MLDLEKQCQGHGVCQSQWPHSMGNTNLKKSYLSIFDRSYRFHDIHISNFVTLKMFGQDHNVHICSGVIRWQIPDIQMANVMVAFFQSILVIIVN